MTSGRSGRVALLVTCEHGGNRVPAAYIEWFKDANNALASHRGYDPGALAMARTLARRLSAQLIFATVSRLVVELNRSTRNPRLFSSFIRQAPEAIRREIFERYYVPYWVSVQSAVRCALEEHTKVVHIGSHSFTPVLDGHVRDTDIGLLYDPARAGEVDLCTCWRDAIRGRAPQWKVRRNYPYGGASDGLTRELRRRFSPSQYIGIELEINQRHPLAGESNWESMRYAIAGALGDALGA
ncbi:MAG TPA: N-formylglutamate amidohydrolase [Casimicrobiaceae bacterium]|jgi:predicted N-formylglutamate amidohydrolase